MGVGRARMDNQDGKKILFANEHGVCDQNAEPKIGKRNLIDGFCILR